MQHAGSIPSPLRHHSLGRNVDEICDPLSRFALNFLGMLLVSDNVARSIAKFANCVVIQISNKNRNYTWCHRSFPTVTNK
jgi:hypothetical protein